MNVQTLTRTFTYNGCQLADPGPNFTPQQVQQVYATAYPEITTAAIEGPVSVNGNLEYQFRKVVGTKA